LYERAILQAELNWIEWVEERFYSLDMEISTIEQEQKFITNTLGLTKSSDLKKIWELRTEKKLLIEKLEAEGLIIKIWEIYQIIDWKIDNIAKKLNDFGRPYFIEYIKKAFKTWW
jgi:hypothetical protein